MSIELKQASEKALIVLGSATSFMSRKARDQHESVVAELRTAIQRAESEPVKVAEWREVIQGAIDALPYQHHLIPRLVALLSANRPAPGVPGALKDHQIAAMVNSLRDIARQFHGHDSLRERIANVLVPALKAEAKPVSHDKAKWCEYVAGMVFAWLERQKNPQEEDRYIKAITGIIERRLWALPPTHPDPGVPDDVVRDAERWRTFLATRPSNTHEGIIAAIDAASTAQKGGAA